ncbi:MAG: hypothetical protein PHW11_07220 [Anaerolineaceae bacterium]|nr:hypothetical protein [Anaerolineaceae bacterium]MDD4042904.1 hypothetical protein [Anaerolineaceae bacterium]MDD4577104.1 hypothetical protein [Anaerolineaceae bacterium]
MYSDDWLKQGYTSGKRIIVDDYFNYRIWTDKEGNEVGVSVSVEAANDFHYDIPISSWSGYVKKVLGARNPEEVTEKFRERLEKQESIYDFEGDLNAFGMAYHKINF